MTSTHQPQIRLAITAELIYKSRNYFVCVTFRSYEVLLQNESTLTIFRIVIANYFHGFLIMKTNRFIRTFKHFKASFHSRFCALRVNFISSLDNTYCLLYVIIHRFNEEIFYWSGCIQKSSANHNFHQMFMRDFHLSYKSLKFSIWIKESKILSSILV